MTLNKVFGTLEPKTATYYLIKINCSLQDKMIHFNRWRITKVHLFPCIIGNSDTILSIYTY